VESLGALYVLGVGCAVAALLVLPATLVVLPRVPWEQLRPFDWSMLAYSVLLSGVFAFLVYYWVMGRTSAMRTALYQYLVPVIAALAARLFLGESLHPAQYLGLILTLAGVYLARPAVRALGRGASPPAPSPSRERG
jgi:drug/metabolite transporter (DMT)-like permease